MPLMEVEEEDFRISLAAKELLDRFAQHPATRTKLLRLVKELNPNASIPELDASDPLRQELETLKSTFTGTIGELKDAIATKERSSSIEKLIESERAKLRAAGWDKDGIDNVEKVMQDRNLVDYEVAAAFVESQLPKATPLDAFSNLDRSWNISVPANEEDTSHKILFGHGKPSPQAYKQFTNNEIKKFYQEKRGA